LAEHEKVNKRPLQKRLQFKSWECSLGFFQLTNFRLFDVIQHTIKSENITQKEVKGKDNAMNLRKIDTIIKH
jgi:hypothetical protein